MMASHGIEAVGTDYNEKVVRRLSAGHTTFKEKGLDELSQAAVGDVLDAAPRGCTLVIESTISPGTIDKDVRPEVENRGCVIGKDVHLAHAAQSQRSLHRG